MANVLKAMSRLGFDVAELNTIGDLSRVPGFSPDDERVDDQYPLEMLTRGRRAALPSNVEAGMSIISPAEDFLLKEEREHEKEIEVRMASFGKSFLLRDQIMKAIMRGVSRKNKSPKVKFNEVFRIA